MRQGFAAILCALTVAAAPTQIAHADTQPVTNKGLYVTPLREYLSADAGDSQHGTLTVANYTNSAFTVTLLAEQFSVTDYTYDYHFETPPKEDWVRLTTTELVLQPYKSQVVNYAVTVPKNATPGGHYFTLIAKTTLKNGSITSNLQAATMLYVTVNGELNRRSHVVKSSAPWVVFGGPISYQLDVKNTGNTHFFVYTSGQLQGPSAKPPEPARAHILFPDTTRSIKESISAPELPGIYKAAYGYRNDDNQVVERSSFVLYLPPWSVLIPVGIVIIFWPKLRQWRKKPTDS